jgi:hypothetical protein
LKIHFSPAYSLLLYVPLSPFQTLEVFWFSHLQNAPISNLALVCHLLQVFSKLNFAPILCYCQLKSLHFRIEICHHTLMWRPWLQLTVKLKILGIVPYMTWFSFHFISFHFIYLVFQRSTKVDIELVIVQTTNTYIK